MRSTLKAATNQEGTQAGIDADKIPHDQHPQRWEETDHLGFSLQSPAKHRTAKRAGALACRLPGGTNADGALDRILAVDCNQPRQ